MAGIYIHIPFCKQACFYCNFHFSTVLQYKERLVKAIAKELFLRKDECKGKPIETIYFGGGTPSLLSIAEIESLFEVIFKHYDLSNLKECTLEGNPDDLSFEFLKSLNQTPVNRLSIGIQSFDDLHLRFMNRAHKANEAIAAVKLSQDVGFDSISIDLIYGLPNMDINSWESNLSTAFDLNIQHLSSYCLTIEPKTVFGNKASKGTLSIPNDDLTSTHFLSLIQHSEKAGFEHYEISNFALPGKYAVHNTNYWKGIPYLGVGPGAHSFSPGKRQWNVAHNQHYIKAIENNLLPSTQELLTENEAYNEFIMTGLRTQWGVDLILLEKLFGSNRKDYCIKEIKKYIESGQVILAGNHLLLSKEGKFLADGIAASTFIIDKID